MNISGAPILNYSLNTLSPSAHHEREPVYLTNESPSYLNISSPLYQLALGYFLSPLASFFKSQATGAILNQSFSVIQSAQIDELYSSILNMSSISITGPVIEEILFRGFLHDHLKEGFKSFYTFCSLSPELVDTLSKISTIFFSAVIFGMAHLINAYSLNCSFMTVYPQVVYATIGGLIYGSFKEYTQDIYLTIGLHVGNNVMAWENATLSSLAKLL